MNYVGIDPGIAGAVAWIGSAGYGVFDIPVMTASEKGKVKWMVDGATLAEYMTSYLPNGGAAVALEHVSSRPGQGVATVFSFGDSFGACRAVVQTLGYDLTLVRPAAWKRAVGLIKPRGDDDFDAKDASLDMARGLFPDAPLTRKRDNNRAEALLLAHWMKTREM